MRPLRIDVHLPYFRPECSGMLLRHALGLKAPSKELGSREPQELDAGFEGCEGGTGDGWCARLFIE